MAKADGHELDVSLKDQLALGRVLHRFLVDDDHAAYIDADDQWLRIEGWLELRRDDESEAVARALWPDVGVSDPENVVPPR